MEKRKNPKEVIETEKKPAYEHAYIKFPGQEMISVEAKSREEKVWTDNQKITKLLNQYRKENYSLIHTHPVDKYNEMGSQFPTAHDFETFMTHPKMKTMVVAQTDKKTGEIISYFVARKKQRVPHKPEKSFFKRCLNKLLEGSPNDPFTRSVFLQDYDLFKNERKLDEVCKGLDLKYKLVYVKEKKAPLLIISLTLLASIFLSLSNLTGFAIAGLSQKTSRILGAILFVLGILGIYIWFKRKSSFKWHND